MEEGGYLIDRIAIRDLIIETGKALSIGVSEFERRGLHACLQGGDITEIKTYFDVPRTINIDVARFNNLSEMSKLPKLIALSRKPLASLHTADFMKANFFMRGTDQNDQVYTFGMNTAGLFDLDRVTA